MLVACSSGTPSQDSTPSKDFSAIEDLQVALTDAGVGCTNPDPWIVDVGSFGPQMKKVWSSQCDLIGYRSSLEAFSGPSGEGFLLVEFNSDAAMSELAFDDAWCDIPLGFRGWRVQASDGRWSVLVVADSPEGELPDVVESVQFATGGSICETNSDVMSLPPVGQ